MNYGDRKLVNISPLLFCLSLIPLTYELNTTKYGYEIYEKTINYLLYMDELRLYAKIEKELEGLLSTVKQFMVWKSGWINVSKQHPERVNLRTQLLLD